MNDDLISRAEAIRWIKTECNPYGKPTLDYDTSCRIMEHLKQMPSATVDLEELSQALTDEVIAAHERIGYEKGIADGYAEAITAEPRWIPVTDAEPQESGDYLLYRPHFWGANKGQITVCYWNGHEWSDNYKNDAERFLPKVYGMAWMPLPAPWKGENYG